MSWRRSERPQQVQPAMAAADAVDMRQAYERGRRDERARRKRHPLLMTLILLAAAAGAAVLAVAAAQGSFARGGAVVDQSLSAAADRAEPAVRQAGSSAAEALRGSGRPAEGEPSQPPR